MSLGLWINKKSKLGYCIKAWNYNWAGDKFGVHNYNDGRDRVYYGDLPEGHVVDFKVKQGEILFYPNLFEEVFNIDEIKKIIPQLKGWKQINKTIDKP